MKVGSTRGREGSRHATLTQVEKTTEGLGWVGWIRRRAPPPHRHRIRHAPPRPAPSPAHECTFIRPLLLLPLSNYPANQLLERVESPSALSAVCNHESVGQVRVDRQARAPYPLLMPLTEQHPSSSCESSFRSYLSQRSKPSGPADIRTPSIRQVVRLLHVVQGGPTSPLSSHTPPTPRRPTSPMSRVRQQLTRNR